MERAARGITLERVLKGGDNRRMADRLKGRSYTRGHRLGNEKPGGRGHLRLISHTA